MRETTRIRRATAADAAALAEIYDPIVRDTVISFAETPPGSDGMRAQLIAAGDTYPWIVFEDGGAVLGYAYASQHQARAAYRWSVNVGIYVAASAQRRGIGRRLYHALFEILVMQGYRSAYAGVTLPNDASCALHASLGFTPVGIYHAVGYKFGAWHDAAWFERRLTPSMGAPVELRSLADVVPEDWSIDA